MTKTNSLPVLGAALTLDHIENIEGMLPFLRDHDRDIELQDLTITGEMTADTGAAIEKKAKRLLGDHRGRIGAHGPFDGLLIDTPDPDIRKIVQKRMSAAMSVLERIDRGRGQAHFVLHSPYTTWSWYHMGTQYDDRAGIEERTHACLKPLVKQAEQSGVTLVLENCEDKDPFDRVRLAESFASPAVRVSLDTGHAHYAHGVTGGPPVDTFVRAAGSTLAHVHLQDADAVADRHWRIGRGNIFWHAVFTAIRELPETPRLIIEMDDKNDVLPSANWLMERELAR